MILNVTVFKLSGRLHDANLPERHEPQAFDHRSDLSRGPALLLADHRLAKRPQHRLAGRQPERCGTRSRGCCVASRGLVGLRQMIMSGVS